jgi:hypothetical protein
MAVTDRPRAALDGDSVSQKNIALREAAEIERLRAALTDLVEYAASVWFDEAGATNEEYELMARARSALRKAP